MSSFPQNATIVLVHGVWADGSCWRNVILPLQKEGLEVMCGPIPLTSLTEDIAVLRRVLERITGPADAHGFIWMTARGFATAVAHTASPDQTAILEAVQRPIAVKCIQEKAPVPAWKTKPSWFLLAEEDRMVAPETQRYMAERRGAKIRMHQVDHTPMHTVPDVVAGVILEAAQQTLASERRAANR